ncbi:MAG: ATP-binding protein [Porphyromonas sp.]|nr:ATP-binding protein [Porphyromonas sp.]
MELTAEIKGRILEGIKSDRPNYTSDSKHATALGISPSVYVALKQGKTDKQLSEANWLSIARRLGLALRPHEEWQAVETATYLYIKGQLEACQHRSLSGLLCDEPNIGKTFTARLYAKMHRNVAYIDCSQVKTKRQLIRQIAREVGLGTNGKYYEMYNDLIYCLQTMHEPLIILDEAGDLQYEAFLELKALWNATEGHCGWYMMGADGLRAKIRRNIEGEKVGYTEIFSRFGNRFNRVTPENEKERLAFELTQAMQVALANAPEGVDSKALAKRSGGLRRVYTEVMKIRKYGGAEKTA